MAHPVATPLRYPTFWFIAGFAVLLGVLALSLVPYTGPVIPLAWSDKIAHVVVFAGLAVWFSAVVAPRNWLKLLALLLLYGALIELLQSFTTYRSMEFVDIVADLIGLTCGWIAMRLGLHNWANWAERLLRLK